MRMFVRRFLLIFPILAVGTATVSAQSVKAVEAEILRHLDNIEKNRDKDAVLDRENRMLKQKLLTHGKRLVTLKHDFKGLAGKMYITTSKDGKFRIYSWDTNTGGTMKFFDGVYQFQGKSGRVYSQAFSDGGVGDPRGFYSQMFQFDTGKRRVYLATSNAVFSTSQMRQDLNVFAIDAEKLNTNVRLIRTTTALRDSVGFDFDFFSVVERPERPVKLFSWDEKRKQFTFPVVLADRKFPNGGRVTDRSITYRFNGKEFVRLPGR